MVVPFKTEAGNSSMTLQQHAVGLDRPAQAGHSIYAAIQTRKKPSERRVIS